MITLSPLWILNRFTGVLWYCKISLSLHFKVRKARAYKNNNKHKKFDEWLILLCVWTHNGLFLMNDYQIVIMTLVFFKFSMIIIFCNADLVKILFVWMLIRIYIYIYIYTSPTLKIIQYITILSMNSLFQYRYLWDFKCFNKHVCNRFYFWN